MARRANFYRRSLEKFQPQRRKLRQPETATQVHAERPATADAARSRIRQFRMILLLSTRRRRRDSAVDTPPTTRYRIAAITTISRRASAEALVGPRPLIAR
jgi:hypothetical protein